MTNTNLQSPDLYYEEIWQQTINTLENSYEDISILVFEDSKLREIRNDQATITTPMDFYISLLKTNIAPIQSTLASIINNPNIKCRFLKESEYQPSDTQPFVEEVVTVKENLRPEFTFDNFIVGQSNKQARSASLFCANKPGQTFNPLFIYGDSGLGKTHLLHAIGNYIKKNDPSKVVLYLPASEFVDRFIKASQTKTISSFIEEMNCVDILLVDDIQILAGKDKTNDMFFQIYNSLVNDRKQIVLTSDKPPQDIENIEERLISRFSQGLTVTISSPEFETCLQFVKMKVKALQSTDDEIFCDEESMAYIATNSHNDFRRIEGMINRLAFFDIQENKSGPITYQDTITTLKDMIPVPTMDDNGITPDFIITTVAKYYNLTKKQLTSKSRMKNISIARHISIYLCRTILDMPYKKIGAEFGGLDHSTVISAIKKIETLYHTNDSYKTVINDINAKLK